MSDPQVILGAEPRSKLACTHRVRGSPFPFLRDFLIWTVVVHVRPYISNCSPARSLRSTAVSWTRPFGYLSEMSVSKAGCVGRASPSSFLTRERSDSFSCAPPCHRSVIGL